MAHFAEVDENNIVLRVIVVDNSDMMVNGEENEQKGVDVCKSVYPSNNRWIQTSYNRSFRKNHAGIGYSYDSSRDAFIPPKPYPSWVLNEATCWWEAPIVSPFNGTDGKFYSWDEDIEDWVELPNVQVLG